MSKTLKPPILKIIKDAKEMEIFKTRVDESSNYYYYLLFMKSEIEENISHVEEAFRTIFSAIISSAEEVPGPLREVLHEFRVSAERKFQALHYNCTGIKTQFLLLIIFKKEDFSF